MHVDMHEARLAICYVRRSSSSDSNDPKLSIISVCLATLPYPSHASKFLILICEP